MLMAGNPSVHILLTRPLAQSVAFGEALKRDLKVDIKALISPLHCIEYRSATLDLEDVHHLVFTSVHGINAFVRLCDERGIKCICVGDKTSEAARAAGLNARSAGGNVSDLIMLARQISHGRDGRFLYLRGQHAAGDLSAELALNGIPVTEMILYDQVPLSVSIEVKQQIERLDSLVIPIFSQRSACALMAELKSINAPPMAAVCISNNVANALDGEQFETIRIAANPTAQSVTREIAAYLKGNL